MNRKNIRIISIVTLYNPNQGNIKNVFNISKQSDYIIICDNSLEEHSALVGDNENVIYLHWKENLGLSRAFNIALKSEKIEWRDEDIVCFFDQDSVLPKDHIHKLLLEYKCLSDRGERIGCIGPVYYDSSTEKNEIPKIYHQVSDSIIEVDSIITTSMMCEYKTLREIGFWNEDIFLDMADWDICWRLLYSGYKVYMTNASILQHRVGEGVKKLGPIRLRIDKPFREYYETRDCIKLLLKKYVPKRYIVRFVAMLTVRLILRVVFLKNRVTRIKWYFKGVVDAIRQKSGGVVH